MKTTISEKKNTLDKIKNTLDTTNKNMSKPDDTVIELPKMKQDKK